MMEDTESSVQNGLSNHDTSALKMSEEGGSLAGGSEGDHADWDKHVSSLQSGGRVLERTQSPNIRNLEDLKTRPVQPFPEYDETKEFNSEEEPVARPVTPPLPESEDEDVSTEPIRPPPEFQGSNDQSLSHSTLISNAHQDTSNANGGSNRDNASDILNDGKESLAASEDSSESRENEVSSPSPSSLKEMKTSEEEREGGRESSEGSSNRSGETNTKSSEIGAVTQAKVDAKESLRTGGEGEEEGGVEEQGVEGEVKMQTSFVNEYALNSTEDSPMSEVDRRLEQFSEILLDSDASHSDEEPPAKEPAEEEEETTSPKMKSTKRVRFADEVARSLVDGQ